MVATTTRTNLTRQNLLSKLALLLGRSSRCSARTSTSSVHKSATLSETTTPFPTDLSQTQRLATFAEETFSTYCPATYTGTILAIARHIAHLDFLLLAAVNSHDYSPSSPIWTLCHPEWGCRDKFMPDRWIRLAEHVARLQQLFFLDPELRIEGLKREVVVSENGREAQTRVWCDVRAVGEVVREETRLIWRMEPEALAVSEGQGRWSCVRMITTSGAGFEIWGH